MPSKKTKIAVVLGTRPDIIKLFPILLELKRHPDHFQTEAIWTGQHIEMALPFLKAFKIIPQHCFEIMTKNQTSADIIHSVTPKLDDLLSKLKPDIVMVQGDTTTAFIAALCAYYHKIPSAHVEAGLRTFDPYSPFPEEKNRELIDHLSHWHFAPTPLAKQNLLREGIEAEKIHVVGNSGVDALKWLLKKFPPPKKIPFISLNPKKEKLLVVTAHRRESFGTPLKNICEAILALVTGHPDLKIIFPVHLNPAVSKPVTEILHHHPRIHLVPPLDYLSFIHLLSHSTAILTDSGGIQEEAPTLGKVLFILREVTERPEGVAAGNNLLVGRDPKKIVTAVEKVLYNPEEYKKRAKVRHPYGTGNTSQKIVSILRKQCR